MFRKWFGGGNESPIDNAKQQQHQQQHQQQNIQSNSSTHHETDTLDLLGSDALRVIVFQETDKSNSCLYDSHPKTHRQVPNQKRNNEKFSSPQLDGRMLQEMIFGAVPLSMSGVATKLHIVPRTRQILITKVFRVTFAPPVQPDNTNNNNNNNNKSNHRNVASPIVDRLRERRARSLTDSAPVVVQQSSSPAASSPASPNHTADGMKRTQSFSRDLHEPASAPSSPGNGATRTWKRTFALALLVNHALPPLPAPQGASSDAGVSAEESDRRRAFIDTHYSLIDYHLNVLCHDVVSCLRTSFHRQCRINQHIIPPTFQSFELQEYKRYLVAIKRFQSAIFGLSGRRRLHVDSVKLTSLNGGDGDALALLSGSKRAAALSIALQHLSRLDQPNNRYFLSTLVTAVLMYNHAWLLAFEGSSLMYGTNNENRNVGSFADQIWTLMGHWAPSFDEQLERRRRENSPQSTTSTNIADDGVQKRAWHTCRIVVRGEDAAIVDAVLVVVSYFVRGYELATTTLDVDAPPLFPSSHTSNTGPASDACVVNNDTGASSTDNNDTNNVDDNDDNNDDQPSASIVSSSPPSRSTTPNLVAIASTSNIRSLSSSSSNTRTNEFRPFDHESLSDDTLRGMHQVSLDDVLPTPSRLNPLAAALELSDRKRLGDLRYSLTGAHDERSHTNPLFAGDHDNRDGSTDENIALIADEDDQVAVSSLPLVGIGTDVSLSAVRRRLARQLRESVELPFLPSPTQLDRSDGEEQLEMPLPRAAFCILADVPTRVCELMYSAAPSHTGVGPGVLQRRPAYDVVASSVKNADDDTLLSALNVQKTRLLPSEHVAATLGQLRELFTIGMSAESLNAFVEHRMALLASLARAVAKQQSARKQSSNRVVGARRGYAAAADALGVAPTDVPLIATLAELAQSQWR